jgi:hypothetical protein
MIPTTATDERYDILADIQARDLKDGILPLIDVADLIVCLRLVNRHPGLHTGGLERCAKADGVVWKGMKWKLACLAILGLVWQEDNGRGGMNWYPSVRRTTRSTT